MTRVHLHSVQANMLEGGGKTPILSPAELEEIGFRLVVYPLSLVGVSMRAMQVCFLMRSMRHYSFLCLSILIKAEVMSVKLLIEITCIFIRLNEKTAFEHKLKVVLVLVDPFAASSYSTLNYISLEHRNSDFLYFWLTAHSLYLCILYQWITLWIEKGYLV